MASQDLAWEVAVSPTTPALGVTTGTITVSVFGQQLLQGTLGPDAFLRGGLMMGAASLTLDIAYSGDMSY